MENALKQLNDYMVNEIVKSQIETIENSGWKVNDLGDQLEIETDSPLGENLVFYLDKNNVAQSATELAANFDVDDHVATLVPMRGTKGVPESITALVDDAKEIESMLYYLAEELNK